jgi:hypothetical protein
MKGQTGDECYKLKAVLEKYGDSKDKLNELKFASSNSIAANHATTFLNDYNDNAIYLFTT